MMNTYRIGRFAIDVPVEFRLAHRKHQFRLVDIEEFSVPNPQSSVQYAEQKWKERLLQIDKLDKPRGVKEIVIKQQAFNDLGHWSRGVLYYGDWMADDEAYLEILVDYGRHLTVFRINGLLNAQEKMFSWMIEIVRAYRPISAPSGVYGFYTDHGVIDLPYKRQERTYVQFKGPMEMVLEVETKDVQENRRRKGIIDRTIAAMSAGFGRGIEVKKIRSRKRVEAGLPGEEEIIQGDYEGKEHLSFDWEYLGEAKSGDRPMVQISMDTFADHLAEKIEVWDGIVGSFGPVGK